MNTLHQLLTSKRAYVLLGLVTALLGITIWIPAYENWKKYETLTNTFSTQTSNALGAATTLHSSIEAIVSTSTTAVSELTSMAHAHNIQDLHIEEPQILPLSEHQDLLSFTLSAKGPYAAILSYVYAVEQLQPKKFAIVHLDTQCEINRKTKQEEVNTKAIIRCYRAI